MSYWYLHPSKRGQERSRVVTRDFHRPAMTKQALQTRSYTHEHVSIIRDAAPAPLNTSVI